MRIVKRKRLLLWHQIFSRYLCGLPCDKNANVIYIALYVNKVVSCAATTMDSHNVLYFVGLLPLYKAKEKVST